MPRTKLDRLAVTPAQQEARIIKAAMARNGLFRDVELARKIKADPGSLSRGFKNGFTQNMKCRMHKVLRFTDEEREALGGWGA